MTEGTGAIVRPSTEVDARQEAVDFTIATVREWHPKCETCGHFGRVLDDGLYWCNELRDHLDYDPKRHGCLAHTDFDKHTENDNGT